jgi:hypothetical protein
VIGADHDPNVDGLRVLLVFELDPPVTAQLAVDLPDGRPLVVLDLTGEEVVRLLGGELLSVPGYVSPSAVEPEPPAAPVATDTTEQLGEVEQLGEPVPDVDETPELPAGEYGSQLDQAPTGTDPITRPTQLHPPHRVVAYVAGRWRDALVVSRDQRTALVAYAVEGPFGDRLRRLTFNLVRLPAQDGDG